MYEELVKRLRSQAVYLPEKFNKNAELLDVLMKAADTIKELETEVQNWKITASEEASGLEHWFENYQKDVPRWIPVTERLPDNIDDEVLVCTEDYGNSGLGFVTVAVYDGNDWLECWERKTYLTAVTHWMPLPQPPKEES